MARRRRAGRTVLLVSHTNMAVDQALLHIASALGPEVAAEGKVLRLGEPKDERVAAQENLLVKAHVERRSAELTARRAELSTRTCGACRAAQRHRAPPRAVRVGEWGPRSA